MISFADAREKNGISLEDASKHIGVKVKTLEYLESNPRELKISDAMMLTYLYNEDIRNIKF